MFVLKGEEEYDYTEEIDNSLFRSVPSFDEWVKREGRTVIQPIFFDFSRLFILPPIECVDTSMLEIDYMLSLLAMPVSFELKRVELRFADKTICLTDCPSSDSSEANRCLLWDVRSVQMTCACFSAVLNDRRNHFIPSPARFLSSTE